MEAREIHRYAGNLRKKYENTNVTSLKAKISRQTQIENEYIQRYVMRCSFDKVRSVFQSKHKVNAEQIKFYLQKQFYNSNVLASLMCLFPSVFTLFNGRIPNNDKIRWFFDTLTLHKSGSDGATFKIGLDNISDIFLVKVCDAPSDATHELFIGIHLNRLRSKILNFPFCFGNFYCGRFVSNRDTKQISWCSEDNMQQYVLYENIAPSLSLERYLEKQRTLQEIGSLYLQILLSLAVAYSEYEFCHYDLHSSNVLIRTLSNTNSFSLEYIFKNKSYKIDANAIATIIDYTRCHINVGGKHYGQYYHNEYGVFPDRSNPVFDVYKITCYMLNKIRIGPNENVYRKMFPLLNYFIKNPTDKFLQQNINDYYVYPEVNFDHEKYIKFVIETLNINVFSNKPALTCDNFECDTKNEIESKIEKSDSLPSLIELYDSSNYDYLEQLFYRRNLEYRQILNSHINRYNSIYELLIGFNNTISDIRYVSDYDPETVLNDQVLLSVYQEQISNLQQLSNLIKDFHLYSNVLIDWYSHVADNDEIESMKIKKSNIVMIEKIESEMRRNFKIDLENLDNETKNMSLRKKISDGYRNQFNWYFSRALALVS